jgi:hypothetical protein
MEWPLEGVAGPRRLPGPAMSGAREQPSAAEAFAYTLRCASSSTAEQRTLNPQVSGSNPEGRTTWSIRNSCLVRSGPNPLGEPPERSYLVPRQETGGLQDLRIDPTFVATSQHEPPFSCVRGPILTN